MGAVPGRDLGAILKSMGLKNPGPRMQMLDGFNEGWIEFEDGEEGSRQGIVNIQCKSGPRQRRRAREVTQHRSMPGRKSANNLL